MRITVEHQGLIDLEEDLKKAGPEFYRRGKRLIADVAKDGAATSKRIARWTSRAHARKYPAKISASKVEMARSGGTGSISAEFGPLPEGQGLLAPILEGGSRNNPAHNNLAQATDTVLPRFEREVQALLDHLFWPQR
ncbi:hypothetical protein [Nocardioides sp.]|uniref:hypothetical protein n=1 Tax=Nocardioides sp. TaxID=35761 RepID=UPI00262E18CB|nr:hypothetical protein [Nocardioides sp.]